MIFFDSINSLEDIQKLIDHASSPDGETSSFELKGVYSRVSPNREDKIRFAKEICAFANSYGGVFCIHKGGDNEIQVFDAAEISDLITRLESWSRDCLEPRCPMRLKSVDGLILMALWDLPWSPTRCSVLRYG